MFIEISVRSSPSTLYSLSITFLMLLISASDKSSVDIPGSIPSFPSIRFELVRPIPYMYVRPISIRLRLGKSTPAILAKANLLYPCLCLCLLFSQITLRIPFLFITLHLLHIFLTDALTFISKLLIASAEVICIISGFVKPCTLLFRPVCNASPCKIVG